MKGTRGSLLKPTETIICIHFLITDAYLALPCSKMAVDEYEYYGISYDTISSNDPSVIL